MTRIVVVPSLLRVLLDTYSDLQQSVPLLRLWTASGETLSVELCRIFRERLPTSKLLNLYGSSEVAADVTWCDTTQLQEPLASISIGRPIANTQIYLLDTYGESLPFGMPGEVHVGGTGLAHGYWQQPGLSAELIFLIPSVGKWERVCIALAIKHAGWKMEYWNIWVELITR